MKNFAIHATCRILCAALLLCALGFVNVGKTSAQSWRSPSDDPVDDAVREQRWRERMDRQATTPPQPPAATPSGTPAAQKPDLSGLPRQLPQGAAAIPEPINAQPDRARVRPNFENIGPERQTLIKPKIGKASDREEKPRTGKRSVEPLTNPVPAMSPSYGVRTQAGRQNVRQPAPVPVPQQATATPSQRVAPTQRPQETPRTTGLIKPRIFGSKSERRRSTVKAKDHRQSTRPGHGQIPDTHKSSPSQNQAEQPLAVSIKAPAKPKQSNAQ